MVCVSFDFPNDFNLKTNIFLVRPDRNKLNIYLHIWRFRQNGGRHLMNGDHSLSQMLLIGGAAGRTAEREHGKYLSEPSWSLGNGLRGMLDDEIFIVFRTHNGSQLPQILKCHKIGCQ